MKLPLFPTSSPFSAIVDVLLFSPSLEFPPDILGVSALRSCSERSFNILVVESVMGKGLGKRDSKHELITTRSGMTELSKEQ